MHKSRLVRRQVVGDSSKSDLLVSTRLLRDRGTIMRIEPTDRSLLARALTRGRQPDPDGGFSIPVEKR